MTPWALVTGEYPPDRGGVADFTRALAMGLAAAGDEVHVLTPARREAPRADPGVVVHPIPGGFTLRGLAALDSLLDRTPRGRRVLVQYAPPAFGLRGFNLAFALWLAARRDERWVLFHEVAQSFGLAYGPGANARALVQRAMGALALRSADRILISIPGWRPILERLGRLRVPVQWTPIPSNVPLVADAAAVAAVRAARAPSGERLVGHFGTYGTLVAPLVAAVLPRALEGTRTRALLLGRGAAAFTAELTRAHPSLAGRLDAADDLGESALAEHLSACDVVLQPYGDGASSRRTSLMAGLALGVPTVTNEGWLSEPLWRESGAVALAPLEGLGEATATLLEDPARRADLGARGRALYRERFSLERLVRDLREPPA